MISIEQYNKAKEKAIIMIRNAGIKVRDDEIKHLEVADFGLSNLDQEGAQIFTFFSTERVGAKVIALFPRQTLPEHWHPPIGENPGKEETVRIIEGTVYVGLPGEDNLKDSILPNKKKDYYTCRQEVVMKPGDQMTLEPGTKHWFQSGDEGAVLYSFSTCVTDVKDQFTDPGVGRITQLEE